MWKKTVRKEKNVYNSFMPEVIPTVSEFRFVRIKRTFQQFALISSARKFNPHSYEPLDD